MKKNCLQIKQYYKTFILMVIFFLVLLPTKSHLLPQIRSAAVLQAKTAKEKRKEACLSLLINRNLPPIDKKIVKGISTSGRGSVYALVGGRNFTAADIDLAEVPFFTYNGPNLSPLYHDGGEWPNSGGIPETDDGRPSFGTDWAGEFYDIDRNGHYPKAVLRYIGNHCYIFVPPMFWPTLPKGISPTQDQTPSPKSEWGLVWPDSLGWGGEVYYYAPATGARHLDPRFVFGSDPNLARLKLKEIADEFDGIIYPRMREYFGNEPDVDGDGKIFLLLDDIRDGYGSYRGYFWAGNQYPRSQMPNSNEKELLYIDIFPSLVFFPKQAFGTLAHEFVHMIHFNEGTTIQNGQLVEEERWLEEGFTQYGQYLYNKIHTSNVDEFIKNPDTILVEPRQEIWLGPNPYANYGASYLFMFYLMEKYGKNNPTGFMKNLVRDKTIGVQSINNALKGYNTTMVDVFCDWVLANFINKTRKLDGSLLNDGKWGYDVDNDYDQSNDIGYNERLPVKLSERVILSSQGAIRQSKVNNWAADYILISGNSGNLNLGFDGDDRGQFRTAVIKRGPQVDPTVEYIYLNDKQAGNALIKNYGAGNTYENLVLVPMVVGLVNYELLNYTFSATFADLKVAVFPNPIFENFLHIVVTTNDKFSSTPRLKITFDGQQGYLTMTPVDEKTYLANYELKNSGEGIIEAAGTTSNGTVLTNVIKFSAVYYPPKSTGMLTANFAKIEVYKNTFENKGGYVFISESTNQPSFLEVQKISTLIDLVLPSNSITSKLKLSIPIRSYGALINERSLTKIGLFREVSNNNNVEFVVIPNLDDRTYASALVDSSGRYFIGIDEIPPKVRFSSQIRTKYESEFIFYIKDDGAGVDDGSIKVTYNNKPIDYRWEKNNGQLKFYIRDYNENEEIIIHVADRLSNWSIIRYKPAIIGNVLDSSVKEAVIYPNPTKSLAKFRVELAGLDRNTAIVEAIVKDSYGDEVFTTILKRVGNGLYEADWNLQSKHGKVVANGVYFVTFEIEIGDKKIKERRKLSILR